ncbi:hypothetical protein N656DRAFT_794817 [Canariomyces notabilis]|uniref:PinX1-related protein 1 n=1 Tax=Canariomyces notabilis TaxID=2074819 RepID=A0AAN6TL84_9PEZI|nr:hypothetical protein N656DRAFT_794817 [Canariomyces arenarius]
MGLAAAKSKRKLGNDPNNTKWSRNTDTFGQKILRAQGWQPGQYLGAKDAPHAEWHSEANSAHIRVVLKDDNLGLGAKRNNGDECTGLDAFQHLLGRLNGKSDEALETERKAREDLKLSLYVERKLGTVRFVKGGWLVGDQLKDKPDEGPAEPRNNATEEETTGETLEDSSAAEPAPEESKKRKGDQNIDGEDEKARKKRKKSKQRPTELEDETVSDEAQNNGKKSKKGQSEKEDGAKPLAPLEFKGKRKKDRNAAAEDSSRSASIAVSPMGESPDEADSSATGKQKLKKEKKARKREKEDKKKKKEKKKNDKALSDSDAEAGDSISREKKRRKDDGASVPLDVAERSIPAPGESALSTPSGSGYSTPVPTGSSRYLARSRFIAQKKLALTDSTALNQIFMIKS